MNFFKKSQVALQGYLAELSLDHAEPTDVPKLSQQVLDGKKASEEVCQYVDWLLSTYNPDPPDSGSWIKPSVHPCQRCHKDIQNSEDDYVDLLNVVQRHTCCSSNYCLNKKQNDSGLNCRFSFPFESCIKTKLEFEPIHSKSTDTVYKAKIVTKRNDSKLNNHQHLQLQGWRANCDIQAVIDYHACVDYLAKYEPPSPINKTAFNAIILSCNTNTSLTKLIKTVIMKSLGQRDFSAQEAMHHLFPSKLVSSSFNVIPISLNGSRKIKTNSAEGDVVTSDSLLDIYANCAKYAEIYPDRTRFNFVTFATKYKLVNSKLVAQPDNIIPRCFPVYSPNNKGPNFLFTVNTSFLDINPGTQHKRMLGMTSQVQTTI